MRLDCNPWAKVLLGAAVVLGGCEQEDDVELRSKAETGGVEAEDAHPELLLDSGDPSEIPGHYIVMLEPGANPHAAAAAVRARPVHVYNRAISGFAGPLNHGQVRALSQRRDVERIERDQVMYATDIECPNYLLSDVTTQIKTQAPEWAPAYSVDRLDQQSPQFSNSYSYTSTGEGVNVYVFDTWMYTAHTDFGGRATAGYDGYPNEPANGQSCSGHGTHVAGIIGGTKYGVAKQANLISVEVLGCDGKGTWSKLLSGIDWVLTNKGNKPAVANMSLSGNKSLIVNAAVNNLAANRVFVAVAAGNNNANACNYSPSSASAAVATAAHNTLDERASFSNYGSCVSVYAGGTNIRSAWSDGGTRSASGTSMASPHVAGVAALYKHTFGDVASSEIKADIQSAAIPGLITGNPPNTANRLLHWPCSGSALYEASKL